MTTAISAPINTAVGSYAPVAKPSMAPKPEPEEIEHPFADIEHQYEGETILKSEVEKVWSDDQSKDLFGQDGFTFGDFLDIINPLQHIPVVSTIYRSISGDEIEPGSRIAGGAPFGGGIGLASALVNAVIEDGTGKDLGDHALAMIGVEGGGGEINAGQLAAVQTASGKALSDTPGNGTAAAVISAPLNTQNNPSIQNARKSTIFDRAPAVPVNSTHGQAFGGIMIPPNGKAPVAQTNEAAATDALLKARSAVPGAGIGGISGIADRGGTNRIARGVGPKTTGSRLAEPIVNPKDPISLSPAVAAQLSKLSQRSAAANNTRPAQQSVQKNVLPAGLQKSGVGANGFNNAAATGPLPNVMLDALDKYEMMVRERQKKNG